MVPDLLHGRRDLAALAGELGADLDSALEELAGFYALVDARVDETTAGLDLPCGRGCADCCHESVFITPLEFLAVWDFVQRELDDAARSQIVSTALAIYEEQADLFAALEQPPPEGDADHLAVAREIRFRCPLLSDDDACRVYPVRGLYGRLFGASFSAEGAVYGCDLVGRHLDGHELTLVNVRGAARQLNELPLTFMRRPFPYYLNLLYG